MRRWLVCSIVTASTLCASASLAQVLGDTSGLSASALAGFATKDLNLGVGARVGYTLPAIPVYVGGTFMYHLGTSETVEMPMVGKLETSYSTYYYGVEGGYNFSLGLVAIRPYLGLGAASGSLTTNGVSITSTDVAFWPGATILVPVGPVFVGGDVRVLLVDGNNSFGAFGTVGMKF